VEGDQDHAAVPQAGSVYRWSGLVADQHASSDYPLTGSCLCGAFLVRDTPSTPWRHRRDDEPPVTEPASGGWLIMPTALTEEHAITPEPDSATRERDGEPASLLRPQDYPVLATCLVCKRSVRCEGYLLGEWAHVIPQQTSPAEP